MTYGHVAIRESTWFEASPMAAKWHAPLYHNIVLDTCKLYYSAVPL